MIQELLGGGAGLLGGERKISIGHGGVLEGTPTHSPSPSPSPSSSTISTTNTNPNNPASNSDQNQNLRCPRCDSSNTKFCYYNNYNLTQPRHFCKTCRRYWTKGGALRNVPIGGGCRKNKSSGMSASVVKSSAASKVKTLSSEMIGKSGFGNGFDNHDFSSNPLLWTSPQNSHILALLRATQNPNPNLNPNHSSITVKDEGIAIGSNTGALNARNLGLDPLISQAPSIGLCSSFWRNNQHQAQQNHHQHQQENGFIVGHEVQNSSGIQELYQRLRSSTNYYTTDHHAPVIMGNVAASSPSTSSILESAPVVGTDLGYWNPAYSWSDLPTTNGAYP